MMVDDIAAYLQTAGHGTVGTDIFKESMPPSPETCTVLYSYGGNPPELIGDIEYPGLQVKVRADGPSNALSRINDVMNKLHTLGETTINTHRYLYVKAVDSCAFAGFDRQTGRAPVYVQNYIVAKEID